MVTIVGDGISKNDFFKLNLNIENYDFVLCDSSLDLEFKNIKKLKFRDIKEFISSNRDKNILYIVTGNPTFFSAGSIIGTFLKREKIDFTILSNTSSKDYLLAKLSISDSQVNSISLHGRDRIDLSRFLIEKYTFILADRFTIDILKKALKFIKKESYEITIASKLGSSDEKIFSIDLENFRENSDLLMPYSILIEKKFESKSGFSSENEFYQDEGMITKKSKRILTIANLELEPNMILFDIGAGSGSVGIDSYKNHRVKTIFFEKNPKRYEDILKNLTEHNIVDTEAYLGDAIDNLKNLPLPDRIFIGGGGEKLFLNFMSLFEKLKESGVILINIVSLTNLNTLLRVLKENTLNFELESISIEDYNTKLLISTPQRVMFQIKVKK